MSLATLPPQSCPHPTTLLTYREGLRGGRRTYWMQCQDCGAKVGTSVPQAVGASKTRRMWDKELEDSGKRIARSQSTLAKKRARSATDREWWTGYEKYLASKEWQERRRLVIERCGNICEGCGLKPVYQIHHLTYEHMGRELLFELVGLCRGCHAQVHPGKEF